MTQNLIVAIAFVTAIVIMATKIMEMLLALKKLRAENTTATTDKTNSTSSRWRVILSDGLILAGWLGALFIFLSKSRPATTDDLILLMILLPAMAVFLRR